MKFLKNKKGFISIYMILWMAVIIPIFMFVFLDVSHFVYERTHLKAITDNASASAVTQIKEELVQEGTLEIDEEKATEVAMGIIQHDLLLNSDMTPKENSDLRDKPNIQVNVVNVTSDEGYDFQTPAGSVKIYKPSVVVYGEYPVRGLMYTPGVNMKQVGVSQVQFGSKSQ